jgi:hypothetical protein
VAKRTFGNLTQVRRLLIVAALPSIVVGLSREAPARDLTADEQGLITRAMVVEMRLRALPQVQWPAASRPYPTSYCGWVNLSDGFVPFLAQLFWHNGQLTELPIIMVAGRGRSADDSIGKQCRFEAPLLPMA